MNHCHIDMINLCCWRCNQKFTTQGDASLTEMEPEMFCPLWEDEDSDENWGGWIDEKEPAQ